jgi:glyoxylase-like metal-dependent hydrolase (beta-lactamase superfamily II)
MTADFQLEDEWYDIVQKARIGLGHSITQVASAAGVSFETLELWESGSSAPNPDQLTSLAAALGLDAGKLLTIQQGGGRPTIAYPTADEPLRVETVTGLMRDYPVHAYLIHHAGEADAVLVDTGYEPIHALEAVLHRRLMLRWIVLTHCHHDHMEGAALLKAQTGARVAVPQAECSTYRAHHREAPDLAVHGGMTIEVSPTITLSAIPTPGHTAGGTSYRIGGVCAVGDALFAGSTGRAMSPAGYRALLSSLTTRILTLPIDTILLPGHGPLTTVGHERQHNPFFPATSA